MPHTYILPAERDQLRRAMRKKNSFWIVKPPNLFCGMGIKVINNFKDVPVKKGQQCVQRYLKKPLLINGLKFDLRVYVLVSSVDPLRVFLYEEGLARRHLLPYSTNKTPCLVSGQASPATAASNQGPSPSYGNGLKQETNALL